MLVFKKDLLFIGYRRFLKISMFRASFGMNTVSVPTTTYTVKHIPDTYFRIN